MYLQHIPFTSSKPKSYLSKPVLLLTFTKWIGLGEHSLLLLPDPVLEQNFGFHWRIANEHISHWQTYTPMSKDKSGNQILNSKTWNEKSEEWANVI